MRTLYLTLLFVLGVLVACGQPARAPGPPTAIPPPSPTRPTADITLATLPDPPALGEVELIITVTEPSGQPVNGADVFVSTDHTGMSGMGFFKTAQGQGNGKYALKGYFGMSGDWRFNIRVKKPPLDVDRTLRLLFK